ncbi:RepB family plasmid replication initiator protein, partial [Pseudomonas helleri]
MAEKSEVVVKSNRLVEASYRLNLVEQQIILFAISRSRDEQLGLSPDKPVTIAASDFAQAFGTNETKVYGQLKEAMGDLFDRSVTIYDTDPDTGK